MDAKCAALANNAVEQQRSGLSDCVVLDEKFLEFINDKHRARNRFLPAHPFVAGDVLHAQVAEQIPAALQLVIEALQNTQPKFTIALNCHHASMGQSHRRIALEFNAFFEIHQVKLHLFRTAPQREVGDDDVEQSGFARAGFTRNQARPIARYCSFVAPVRPIGTRNSVVVSSLQTSGSGGAT